MCRSKCNIQPVCMGGNWNSAGGNSFVCGQNGGGGGFGYNPGYNSGYNPGYNSGYNPGYNQVHCLAVWSSPIFLLSREAWLEVAGCREEPVEVLERLLQRSCPPGLWRSRRRLCPPSVPHCLSNHTLAVYQCHSFTKLFSKNNFMENSV